jgi:hypothetical protein
MERYARKSVTTSPEGRCVVVSTVRHALVTESAVFPADKAGRVTSAMHLHKVKHGAEDDLDAEHDAIVAGVRAGTITLLDPDREPTLEEAAEAMGDLVLLDKMAIDGEPPNA